MNHTRVMRKLTIVFVFLSLAMVSNAQLRYGIKAGADYSDLSVSSSTTPSTLIKEVTSVPSWRAGLMLQYKMSDFAIQSELLYSVEGGDLLNTNPGSAKLTAMVGSETTVKFRSQNLQIPLNLQYGRDLGAMHLYALVGPYLSYMLTGTINGETSLWNKVEDEWGFNRFNLGFGVGAGAELKHLQLTLRYDFGGTEVGKKITSSFVSTNLNPFYDMKERNLSLSLGYFF
jgi:hypothetical protein